MENDDRYLVIANCEDELALWVASQEIPASWRPVAGAASRAECLAFLQRLDTERRASAIRSVLESHKVYP